MYIINRNIYVFTYVYIYIYIIYTLDFICVLVDDVEPQPTNNTTTATSTTICNRFRLLVNEASPSQIMEGFQVSNRVNKHKMFYVSCALWRSALSGSASPPSAEDLKLARRESAGDGNVSTESSWLKSTRTMPATAIRCNNCIYFSSKTKTRNIYIFCF